MRNLRSGRERRRRPIRNLLSKAIPLVASIAICASACAPVKPPKAKPAPVKIVKKDPMEALVKALRNPDPAIRRFALDSVLLALEDADQRTGKKMYNALMSAKKHIIPDLVNMLETYDLGRREVVKYLLVVIGMAAVPELVSRIQVSSFGCRGMPEADMIVDIINVYKEDPRAKRAARSVLRFLFSAYEFATPLGVQSISYTLNRMDKKAVVRYAREVSNDRKPNDRLLSVIILGNHGGRMDLAALRRIAKNDPLKMVRENAKEAIKKIIRRSP